MEIKVGARVQPVSFTGRKKVTVTKREKERDDKKKKTTDDRKKFGKKVAGAGARLDPTAFLKGSWGCLLDHRYLPIRALRPYFDLLSLHIGRFSNIQPNKVSKRRVLQRVLRYYHGSTRFG